MTRGGLADADYLPLALAGFMDHLRVQQASLVLERPQQFNSLGGGELLAAELAPPYWRGSVTLTPMQSRDADQLTSRLEALAVPGRSFEICHPHRIGPRSDPLGAALAGFSPVIEEVPADPGSLKLGGLPSGYELSPGDLLAFSYNPGTGQRRALHRVVEGATASSASAHGGFQAGPFEVAPYVRPGVAAGASVSLIRPACLAVLVPGSVSSGISRGSVTYGLTFNFRQKLRA
ncbi:hypothetical protein ETW23_03905 [Leisingera sp. NJS201]|uniref:hypothetical protein n=1 Tax=Leisingera sp. NJS201 TaxID=2508306 RepID=UPI001070CD77|nr:hypothetical protein [Leisingera sp. NJS201]QBR35411.1 hypothetical protein ETW23_03905 [Leisingera sp. NJS201]